MQRERRTNVLTAVEINHAVLIDQTQGAIAAWVFLTRRGIPSDTIQRILIPGVLNGERRSLG